MTMPAASRWSWADLNSELVVSIAAVVAADGSPLTLRDYERLRCVCAAWRSALAPPYPCLLSLADGGASVFSLPMRRSLRLYTSCEALDDSLLSRIDGPRSKRSRYRIRVIGSAANGRLAVAVDRGKLKHGRDGIITCVGWRPVRILLLEPRRGSVVAELSLPYECVISKVVFTTDAGHGTVVASCDHGKMVYVGIGSGWRRDMEWTAVDDIDGDALADLAFDAGGERLYCLDSGGAVLVHRIPRSGQEAPAVAASAPPLTRLSAVFPAPYDAASTRLTRTKHLFFCHGSLYQIWQRTAAAVKPGSGLTTMPADEIVVLRYDPKRWPAWEAVKDLGGRSVFIGQNSSPVVVRAAGVGAMPRVRPDCVYWINCLGIPMVCHVAAGSASEPCVTPCSGVCRGDCWYFGDENTASIDRGGRE